MELTFYGVFMVFGWGILHRYLGPYNSRAKFISKYKFAMWVKIIILKSIRFLSAGLRGHLGVPNTVSEPLVVPLKGDSKHMISEIECFHRYWNSASRTPRYPLKF